MSPIFLAAYKPIEALLLWRGAEKEAEVRQWTLTSRGRFLVVCCLSWRFRNGQNGSIDMMAPTLEEAVWNAIEKYNGFDSWSQQHASSLAVGAGTVSA